MDQQKTSEKSFEERIDSLEQQIKSAKSNNRLLLVIAALAARSLSGG